MNLIAKANKCRESGNLITTTEEMLSIMRMLSAFQDGDSDRLLFARDYLKQTNCPMQCLDAVDRMREIALKMERSL